MMDNDKLRFGIVRRLGSKTHKPRYLTKDKVWTTDRNICGWFTAEEVDEYGLNEHGTFEVSIYLNFNEVYNAKSKTVY